MSILEKAEKVKLNSIVINTDTEQLGEVPVGASKIGGRPDLPIDFQWFYFKGVSNLTDELKARPLSFLAQINCEKISKYDLDKRLPDKGMLYFFYELESMPWGFDPKDKGCARVFYYSGDISELVRTDFPADLENEYRIPEMGLSFTSKYNVPDYEELFSEYNTVSWEEYDEALEDAGYLDLEKSTKLLGYADTIQGEMLLECELVTNGLYCGDSTGYDSPKRKKLEQNKEQWKLLFQLDTEENGNYELMFGDCGRIYYYIKEDDLINGIFENTWLILQCS